jgi:hypothetical protein
MIESGGVRAFAAVEKANYDWLIYGLGFETRSPKIASIVDESCKIIALKMPERRIHSYTKNAAFAAMRKHIVPPSFQSFLSDVLPKIFSPSKKPLRICFDISSVNRIMLADTIVELARLCRPADRIDVVYCPASFHEPDWQFPQIERIGPINATLSSIESDLNKPLCLVLGAGFEAGISMGLVSQLEPRLSYCFWGTGIDSRFDRAVRRANFEFEFGGFNTKPVPYNIKDPKGAFIQLESAAYGFTKGFRVIVIPMGPKLFTMLSTLLGMLYVGQIAVWRVQHSRMAPPDAVPSDFCIAAQLDTLMLMEFAQREKQLMSLGIEKVA